jgi:hypothetical protein
MAGPLSYSDRYFFAGDISTFSTLLLPVIILSTL